MKSVESLHANLSASRYNFEMITLGSKVRDRISGTKGMVIGRAEYLYGSPQILFGYTEIDSNGKISSSDWFDEARFEVIEDGNRPPLGFTPNSSAKA